MRYASLAAVIATLLSISLYFGFWRGLENYLEDLLFSAKPIDKNIVIVAIDNQSIEQIGQWPWPREVFAKALSKLEKAKPKSVGLDIMFSEASRLGNNDDLALKRAIENISYSLVLPVEAAPLIKTKENSYEGVNFIKPLDLFTQNKNTKLGHVNLILDLDGIVRRYPPEVSSFHSFSNQLTGIERKENPTRIVYSAPSGSMRRIPFFRLLEEDLDEELKNKIILVGATAPDLHDEKPTPFSKGTQMTGVEIQGNIVNMLMRNYRITPFSYELNVAWIFLASLIAALIFKKAPKINQAILANLALGLIYFTSLLLIFEKGGSANLIHINLAWILSTAALSSYRYIEKEEEQSKLKSVFAKYVAGDVLDEIIKNPGKVILGGEEKEITVLFSDIRGFTSMAEKIPAREVVAILNRYFDIMSKEILKHGGVIDKYIGDAIMAYWGAPLKDPEQADKALSASKSMLAELKKLNEELRLSGADEINIGIGLYTGPAIVGNIGAENRFDYTAIGDTVNVAARLNGLSKEYKSMLIIGESTKNKLTKNTPLVELGSTKLRGRNEAINIYTIK